MTLKVFYTKRCKFCGASFQPVTWIAARRVGLCSTRHLKDFMDKNELEMWFEIALDGATDPAAMKHYGITLQEAVMMIYRDVLPLKDDPEKAWIDDIKKRFDAAVAVNA